MSDGTKAPLIVRTFMTHDMKDEEIEALSTGREAELKRILAAVDRSLEASPGRAQHVVVYGARGYGKSFMMRRVQIELARRADEGTVKFLLLPEEQHNLRRSPHALLETIALKLEHLEAEDDDEFQEAHFRWPRADEAGRLWDAAQSRLETALDGALPDGRGLVVVAVENFDILLATLFKDELDEQRLRAWLDRDRARTMLVATATGTVDMDYERPLFKAFEPVRLSPWNGDDCIAYFNRQRAYDGRPSLEPDQEAKARAIAEFIGGAPRLAQLLGEVLDTQDALTVAETMSALADRLAEYYRRRIEDLSELAQGLLDALIRGGEPASQTELAQRVGADGQSRIARVMSDLQRAEIVRGRPAPESREKLYGVVDRVFVHYYRLRQGSRKARDTPLETILEFLRSFYSRDEQRVQALAHLEAGRLPEARLFDRLARDGDGSGRHGSYIRYFPHRLATAMNAVPGVFRESAEALSELTSHDPVSAIALARSVEAHDEAQASVVAIVEAYALVRMGHLDQAERTLDDARSAGRQDAVALVLSTGEAVMFQYYVRGRSTRAIELALSLESVATAGLPQAVRARSERVLTYAYAGTGRAKDALEASKRAERLAESVGDIHGQVASLLNKSWSLGRLGRHEAAVETADRVVNLAAKVEDVLGQARGLRYKSWSLGQQGLHEEAVETADRAVNLAAKVEDVLGQVEGLRHKSWSLGILGLHEEAVETADRAVNLAASGEDVLGQALGLQRKSWSLGQLGRHEEAWAAAVEAAACARAADADEEEFPALLYAIHEATFASQSTVVELFRRALALVITSGDLSGSHLALEVPNYLVAAAIADVLPAAEALLSERWRDLDSRAAPVWFHGENGRRLAEFAARAGRAEGLAAMSALLDSISRLVASLPSQRRDRRWLYEVCSGFAGGCRDPGLLRDLASVLHPELAPQADQVATLLRSIADVDEGQDPEAVLARTDPDVALLVRRIRDLPEPEAPSSARRRRRRR